MESQKQLNYMSILFETDQPFWKKVDQRVFILFKKAQGIQEQEFCQEGCNYTEIRKRGR
ncbi:unnamed protein product [Paramecium octaurelia]|uniref:Uncharacterized protein n=1 Tax=Paramecium octaurelia TaxID=43137 RepID=A0A8S1XC50_PAROT|nr:unnamed protein product [Paramecium octaurelia]